MSATTTTFERPAARVVIVGAGFGGLRAGRPLRDAPVRVTVIAHGNAHVFQPLLYQVATAELSPADISAPIRGILRRQANAEVVLGEVAHVDTAARSVRVRGLADIPDRTIPYDYLVLATGARESYFGPEQSRPFPPRPHTTEPPPHIPPNP